MTTATAPTLERIIEPAPTATHLQSGERVRILPRDTTAFVQRTYAGQVGTVTLRRTLTDMVDWSRMDVYEVRFEDGMIYPFSEFEVEAVL